MSGALVVRPVRLSTLPEHASPLEEMELVRERFVRLAPDSAAELFLFQASPTAAFSRRDALSPGYERAVEAVSAFGFTPVVRPVGGRLAVYDEGSLVLYLCAPHPDPRSQIEARFVAIGGAIAAALRGLGVDARLGPVPGEYCDGKFSVNDSGRTKLAGTGQRIGAGGYLFTAVVMVRRSSAVPAALSEAYHHLGLAFDAASVGAVDRSVPSVTASAVRRSIISALSTVLPFSSASDPCACSGLAGEPASVSQPVSS